MRAAGRTRTDNPRFTRAVRYQLRHGGLVDRAGRQASFPVCAGPCSLDVSAAQTAVGSSSTGRPA